MKGIGSTGFSQSYDQLPSFAGKKDEISGAKCCDVETCVLKVCRRCGGFHKLGYQPIIHISWDFPSKNHPPSQGTPMTMENYHVVSQLQKNVGFPAVFLHHSLLQMAAIRTPQEMVFSSRTGNATAERCLCRTPAEVVGHLLSFTVQFMLFNSRLQELPGGHLSHSHVIFDWFGWTAATLVL